MKDTRRAFWSWLAKKLRAQFAVGILVLVPIGATILILVWLFNSIDDILQPAIKLITGRSMSWNQRSRPGPSASCTPAPRAS
jgi:hypothetical protein